MTKDYYGTKRITAWPENRGSDPQSPHFERGYAVKYSDDYVSWSPADVFEAAYQSIDDSALSFGHAIEAMRAGHRVARQGWNGKGMWLEIQIPDEGSKMSLPYIYMRTVQGDLVPWLASQTDMLSNDWGIVE